jgi:hypothetical protein
LLNNNYNKNCDARHEMPRDATLSAIAARTGFTYDAAGLENPRDYAVTEGSRQWPHPTDLPRF